MAERKLISLCMIVKNEEENLPRCLQSVHGAVDEIIIVDTGSEDRTVEIAQQYGAVIVTTPWQDNFAQARNAGLSQAAGDWILFLDADEELEQGCADRLRHYAEGDEAVAYLLQVWNYGGTREDGGAAINPVLRMFRNRPQHRFVGRIHEQIAAPILEHNAEAKFELTDIRIHHYGYHPRAVADRDKVQRNTKLLEQTLLEEPGQPFHLYNLGVEYLRSGRAADALACFRAAEVADSFLHLNFAHLVLKYQVRCLLALGALDEALEAASGAAEKFHDYPDIWHYKAAVFTQLGRNADARAAAQRALELGPAQGAYHTEDGMGTHQTAYLLGQLYEADWLLPQAVKAYEDALRLSPGQLAPLLRICRLMSIEGKERLLLPRLQARFAWHTPQAMERLANALRGSGCWIALESWTRLHPEVQGADEGAGEGTYMDYARKADRYLSQCNEAAGLDRPSRCLQAIRLLLPM
ncbi:glycosyltransferase [Paenibacillus sp. GCM10023252]|uniref:glycosyltransferase n=1 Tax=Paenibacillus sp. GCM10023252 TaxID=3252649 RepID=UPI00360689A5